MEIQVFKLNKKQPKGLLIFAGILFTLNGINAIISNAFYPFGLIAGGLMVIFGLLYLIKPELLTTSYSKVELNDNFISIKKSLLSKSKQLIWEDIKSIDMDSYYIRFDVKKGQESIRYESDPEISIALKKSLQKIAADKGIPVKGG